MGYSKRFTIFAHIALIGSILIIAFPVIFALIVSTHTFQESFAFPPPFHIGGNIVHNYVAAWNRVDMGRLLFNSSFISVAVSIGKIGLSMLAAFAFTYFGDFRGKYFFFILILITHMLPLPIRIVPTFELMDDFHWINTYYALTIPFFASATGMLLFRQFFLTVPDDLCDAARMDGAGPMKFFWKILVPLSKTNMMALFLIEFIYMWNQYLWPLIVTNTNDMRVVQIGIKMLLAGEEQAAEWNVIMAGTITAMIPPLIILLLMQSSLVKGFVMKQEK
ncbi:MAG: ABC transporter permease subunit [Deltaproteobacteria bacterium]|nr:ABC transporter permease subunit [Deltaproteobacteria bacterium]